MTTTRIDLEHEADKLLNNGTHTMQSLALDLVTLRLQELPALQEQVDRLKVENRLLQEEVAILELDVDCGAYSESEVTEESEWTMEEHYDETDDSASSYTFSDAFGSDRSYSPPLYGLDNYENSVDSDAELSPMPDIHFEDVFGLNFNAKSYIEGIPVEIMQAIFEFVLPPWELVAHTNQAGVVSSWSRILRMKKSLTLVNKRWHSLALPFLYADVVLRRDSQIFAIARTISEDPTTFGRLVKRLVFALALPGGLTDEVQTSIISIADHCPSLRELSFEGLQPLSIPEDGVFVKNYYYLVSADAEHPRFRVVESDSNEMLALWPVRMPSARLQNLRSLEIPLGPSDASDRVRLKLPLLDTLIICQPFGLHDLIHYSALPTQWDMPSLLHVRFRSSPDCLFSSELMDFFDVHGSKLLSLGFGRLFTWIADPPPYVTETLLAKCPLLEHFVYMPRDQLERGQIPNNRALKHIDVIVSDVTRRSKLIEICREKASLIGTGWQSVRFFHNSVVEIFPDLPFSPVLPRTRDELNTKGPFDVYGYQFCVMPPVYKGEDVPELIFYEPWLEPGVYQRLQAAAEID